jgi:hypothetical protein
METIWKSAIEISGKRWLFVAFTPALLLCSLLILLLLDVKNGVLFYWNEWLMLSVQGQMLLLISFLIIAIFTSFVLDMLGNTVLSILIGQVNPFGFIALFYKWRKRHYQNLIKNYQLKFSDLQRKDIEQKLSDFERMQKQRLDDMLMGYPMDAEKAMPTILGNIIRSTQEKISARYGLDTRATWFCLYPSISDVVRSTIDNCRDLLDFSVRLIVVWSIFIFACLPFSMSPTGWGKSMVLIGFSFLMILVFYGLANRSARNYSELLYTAYALHRFDLYEKLKFELPECSGKSEKMCGEILSEFLWRGRDGLRYVYRDDAKTGGHHD